MHQTAWATYAASRLTARDTACGIRDNCDVQKALRVKRTRTGLNDNTTRRLFEPACQRSKHSMHAVSQLLAHVCDLARASTAPVK